MSCKRLIVRLGAIPGDDLADEVSGEFLAGDIHLLVQALLERPESLVGPGSCLDGGKPLSNQGQI